MKTLLAHPVLRLMCLITVLSGCAVTDRVHDRSASPEARWAVLTLENTTTTPMAGARAEAVARALLHTLGVKEVVRPPAPARDALFDPAPAADTEAAIHWARSAGVRYLLTGTVDEWQYKVGVDGEPAVGLALHIIDVDDGSTVWTGVGARTGWGRDSLAAVAQTLIKSLLAPVVR